MSRTTPPADFECPYRHACPYLEGLSTQWVWGVYQDAPWHEHEQWQTIDELDEQVNNLQQRVLELEKENVELRAKLQALHRKQFKPNRKNTKTNGQEEKKKKTKKRGAPKGHLPWTRAKPKHIDKRVSVPAPQQCPHCNAKDLGPMNTTTQHLQEDIVLVPRAQVTCFEHHQAYCPHCQTTVIQAAEGEILHAPIGPVAKATASYLRYRMGLSYRNIQRLFDEMFGLKFVPASALGFDRQIAKKAAALYEDLREKVRASQVIHADETGWRVDGLNHYLWFAGNPDLAFFHIDRHRSTQVAQDILGQKLDAVLVTDGYAVYENIPSKAHQTCLGHLLRDARAIIEQLDLMDPPDDNDLQLRRFANQIKRVLKDACQWAHDRTLRNKSQKERTKIQQRLAKRIKRACVSPFELQAAEQLRKRLLRDLKRLFVFIDHPDVPPTNNHAEQSLRPSVIMRKVIFGNRSQRGAKTYSILSSLLHTAKKQNRDIRLFFHDLLLKSTSETQTALYQNPSWPQGP